MQFDHEKLDVYRASIQFSAQANQIISSIPKGNAKLADQLFRASTSITLNIAEGAGLYGKKEKNRSYRIAKGSANECAAAIDLCTELKLAETELCKEAKQNLFRIVSMLTKLIQSLADRAD
jgi:four helix bundle protein